VQIVAVADLRPNPGPVADTVRALGIEVLAGHTVIEANGRKQVAGAVLAPVGHRGDGQGGERTFACDLVLVSGGAMPATSLLLQAGAQTRYDEAIGHFMMAVEQLFLFALLALILGNGAFKPNISTQVGGLYPPGDHRRDRAYSIFYVGINVGAFLAPLVCGTLGEKAGWHYGFAAAGVGMCIGLSIYLYALPLLPPALEARTHRVTLKPETRRSNAALFGKRACTPTPSP